MCDHRREVDDARDTRERRRRWRQHDVDSAVSAAVPRADSQSNDDVVRTTHGATSLLVVVDRGRRRLVTRARRVAPTPPVRLVAQLVVVIYNKSAAANRTGGV